MGLEYWLTFYQDIEIVDSRWPKLSVCCTISDSRKMIEDVTRSYSQYIREENLQAVKEMIADESETEDIIRDSIRVEGEVSEQYFVEEISKIVSQQYIMVNDNMIWCWMYICTFSRLSVLHLQGSLVKSSFIKLLVSDPDDNEQKGRQYVRQWIEM